MPVPSTELERHQARKVGKIVQEEAENEEKQDFQPKKSGLSKIERFNRFFDSLVTPRGT